jgi:beta-phosphoglucomutase-like phosphatase (HAD superfamily)
MIHDPIALFDVLGPAYHYDPHGWIESATDPGIAKLKEHGYNPKTLAEAARDEEDMVINGKEAPLIMPGFAETVLYLREKGIAPVVVSAGTPRLLEHMIDAVARDHTDRTKKYVTPEHIVHPDDLISTVDIGDKKVPLTWKKAIEGYNGATVMAVWEDSYPNITAAIDGTNALLGFHVISAEYGLARSLGRHKVVRGSMNEILKFAKLHPPILYDSGCKGKAGMWESC